MSIGMTTLALFLIFFVFLFLGLPISVSILISSIATAMLAGLSWEHIQFIAMQKMNSGIESFSLLAVPLFILAGNIMNNGGIARRLIDFSEIFVGNIKGSLSLANALGNMIFGALSGSGVAAASAMGGTIYPVQEEAGYDKEMATAVNIASAPAGLLVPPTSAPIVYSTVAGGVSISAMFMAGYIPGILMTVIAMFFGYRIAKRDNYPVLGRPENPGQVTLRALPSLLMIIVVIGGIVGGIFTATEGSAISVIYALILGLIYRNLNFNKIVNILVESAKMSAIVVFLIGVSNILSWVMAFTGIPQMIGNALLSITSSPIVLLLIINVILLISGTFMDVTPAILIFTPLFLPIVESFGMSPVQFGLIMVYNLCIGNITPPVGNTLFVAIKVGDTNLQKVIPYMLRFYVFILIGLILVTYIPAITLSLPQSAGLL